jgi:hypothetical protein
MTENQQAQEPLSMKTTKLRYLDRQASWTRKIQQVQEPLPTKMTKPSYPDRQAS